jgi:cytidylate kinase
VLENLRFRDHEDTNRAVSPLKQADDAIVIDNTELDEDEQMDVALGHAIRVMAMAGS